MRIAHNYIINMKFNHCILVFAFTINLLSFLNAQSPTDTSSDVSSDASYNLVNSNEFDSNVFPLTDPIDDKTCENKDTEAAKCFNYFIFSIYWPPGLGYSYKSRGMKIVDRLANQKFWSIHGLWPTVESGRVPNNCHDPFLRFQFSINKIKAVKYLYQALENRWFNIADDDNRQNAIEHFWKKQYDHHGACASRATSIKNPVGYFQAGLNMIENINPSTLMQKCGLAVGGSVNIGNFYDTLTLNIGSKVKVEFAKNTDTQEYYLSEIRICYDLALGQINCPGNHGPSKKLRLQSVKLLSSLPT